MYFDLVVFCLKQTHLQNKNHNKMGHYSLSCGLTGLPISGDDRAVIIPMITRKNFTETVLNSHSEYGVTDYMSHENTRLFYCPCLFPISGIYDNYGRLKNIRQDEATAVLEKFYGLSIENIVNVITSNRKNDGYDKSLNIIKDKNQPQATDDNMINPKYQYRYKSLLSISVMWVRGEVYDKIANDSIFQSWDDNLDIGSEYFLNALGFVEIEENKVDPRYRRQFKKGNLILRTDGSWIRTAEGVDGIYTVKNLAKYCKHKGEPLDQKVVDKYTNSGIVEQAFDILIPRMESLVRYDDYHKNVIENQTIDDCISSLRKTILSDIKTIQSDFVDNVEMSVYDLAEYVFKNNILEQINSIEASKTREDFLDEDQWILHQLKQNRKFLQSLLSETNRYVVADYFWEEFCTIFIDAESFFKPNSSFKIISKEQNKVASLLMNTNPGYITNTAHNKLTLAYFDAIKNEGANLLPNALGMYRFNRAMYAMGRYYLPCGTPPQDSEHEQVMSILVHGMEAIKPQAQEAQEYLKSMKAVQAQSILYHSIQTLQPKIDAIISNISLRMNSKNN